MILRFAFLWLMIPFLLASWAETADESVGGLDERALQFHEALFEARLSLDDPSFEREWHNLVHSLKASLQGKAGVVVTGDSAHWRARLTPRSGPFWVSATPEGVQLRTADDHEATDVKTLLFVYPLRRHYDCAGKAFEPAATDIPEQGRPCAPPPRSQATVMRASPSSDADAILSPLARMTCCYLVVSSDGGILEPGQVLVTQAESPYKMHSLQDQKMRLLYRENMFLFVMDRKQPKLYRVELN